VQTALRAGLRVVFFLTGTVFDLQEAVSINKAVEDPRRRTLIFAHIDLIQGIGRDPAGMRVLAKQVGVDGILTTRSNLIRAAKDEGLYTIQRLFILDSESLKTAVQILNASKPDAVELLPALVLPNIQRRLPVDTLPPIIAGGLVETQAELQTVLRTPAKAVSTSAQTLWFAAT